MSDEQTDINTHVERDVCVLFGDSYLKCLIVLFPDRTYFHVVYSNRLEQEKQMLIKAVTSWLSSQTTRPSPAPFFNIMLWYDRKKKQNTQTPGRKMKSWPWTGRSQEFVEHVEYKLDMSSVFTGATLSISSLYTVMFLKALDCLLACGTDQIWIYTYKTYHRSDENHVCVKIILWGG